MDYNIYIHDKTGGSKKPTVPKTGGGTNTAAKSEDSEKESANGAAFVKAVKGSTIGKIAIAVYAAYKVSDKVVSLITPFVTKETGDYRFAVAYENVKQGLSNFFNPIGASLNIMRYSQDMTLFNRAQEQRRLLVGDAYLNSVSRKV